MRVLHVITGLNNGGAEGALYRLATSSKNSTHHVVSMMDAGTYGPRLAAAGIPVTTLGMPRRRVTLRGLLKLYRLMRSIDPDVVQTWLYHSDFIGSLLARLTGKPSVWGIRNTVMNPAQSARSTRWLLALCARTSSWLPRSIVSCSVEAARDHAAAGYQWDKIIVIPNGFDLVRLAPDAAVASRARSDLGIPPSAPLLGMIARWDPQKDHATLAAALELVADSEWRLVLAGPGVSDDNVELVNLLDRHGLRSRCQLLGPRSDIQALMNAFDIHVLSSAYGEAFPNVVAEAMACGTPCVATDVGDSALIIGETGWIVPPSDQPKLASALREALLEMQDQAGWERRCAAARQQIESNFGMERMVRGYRDVWRAATGEVSA